ncbi:hypothetical protein DFJ74DRAFT_765007 [Hyaloraphidium curvatum]|nr:hypothetical protein DFJ74DRAFT_765007 [Hyaloraphidium curvatum]
MTAVYSSVTAFPPVPPPLPASPLLPAAARAVTLNGTAVAAALPAEPALPSAKPAAADVSFLGQIELLGPDAEAAAALAFPSVAPRTLPAGAAVPIDFAGQKCTLYRMCDTNFRLVVRTPGGTQAALDALNVIGTESGLKRLRFVDASPAYAKISVLSGTPAPFSGVWTPKARPAVAELPPGRFTVGRFGDDHGTPLVVGRPTEGEYEVFCAVGDAEKVWAGLEKVEAVGAEAWIKFVGV